MLNKTLSALATDTKVSTKGRIHKSNDWIHVLWNIWFMKRFSKVPERREKGRTYKEVSLGRSVTIITTPPWGFQSCTWERDLSSLQVKGSRTSGWLCQSWFRPRVVVGCSWHLGPTCAPRIIRTRDHEGSPGPDGGSTEGSLWGSLEGQREPPKYKATFLDMKEELLSAARTRMHLCHGSFRRGGYRERNPKGLQERWSVNQHWTHPGPKSTEPPASTLPCPPSPCPSPPPRQHKSLSLIS